MDAFFVFSFLILFFIRCYLFGRGRGGLEELSGVEWE